MKKTTSQIFVAVVCALLGFLLAYQFKVLAKQNNGEVNNMDKSNIIAEVEGLKKEKDDLLKSNKELSDKIKSLEDAASKEGDLGKEVKKQLDISRMFLGTVDVSGPGIVVTISPKQSIFGNDTAGSEVSESQLVQLINTIWFSGAEAISVNDFRITPQTAIKLSGNGSDYLWVGSAGKVSPKEPITIKAIGDKKKMRISLDFPGATDILKSSFIFDIKEADNILIPKTTQSLRSDFVKVVKE